MKITNLLAVFLVMFTVACTSSTSSTDNCGDGIIDVGEECDGTNFGGASCIDLGYYGGELYCTPGCALDKSACIAAGRCGDSVIQYNELEECDGYAFGGGSCADEGYSSGDLLCDEFCHISLDECSSECGMDQVFFNSPNPNCSPTSQCGIVNAELLGPNPEIVLECRSEDQFVNNTFFYQQCQGLQYLCPHGAICTLVLNRPICMPVCHGIFNPNCPGNGVCVVDDDALGGAGICFQADSCDPIMDTGCDRPAHCYLLNRDGDGLCVNFAETLAFIDDDSELPGHDEPCLSMEQGNYDACSPGHTCITTDSTSQEVETCKKLCHPGSVDECDVTEECTSIGVGWLGACLTSDSTP